MEESGHAEGADFVGLRKVSGLALSQEVIFSLFDGKSPNDLEDEVRFPKAVYMRPWHLLSVRSLWERMSLSEAKEIVGNDEAQLVIDKNRLLFDECSGNMMTEILHESFPEYKDTECRSAGSR